MTRYLQAGDVTLEQFAKDERIALSTAKRRSSSEGWVRLKTEMIHEAMELARVKVIQDMAGDAASRMRDWLEMADALKIKALTALTQKGAAPMTTYEAVRAIQVAAQLESRALLPQRSANAPAEDPPPPGVQQLVQVNLNGQPGDPLPVVSAMPDIDTQDISEAALRQIIVDAEVVDPKKTIDAQSRRRGDPAPADRPK